MCHHCDVSLINLRIQPGSSIFEQLVAASIKACVIGEFKEGQRFPSVRTLATDFKIHPNTAQKVIQHLIREGFLEVWPGIGTVVARLPTHAADRTELLRVEVERFVEEALRLDARLPEAIRMVKEAWTEKTPTEQEVTHDHRK
jgi:GntR family transcriptional regulator